MSKNKRATFALDQSSTHVGWVIMLNGAVESFGEYKPDAPNYDEMRRWVKDFIGTLQDEGYTVEVALESIYMAMFGGKPQVHTYSVLTRTQSHIWAAARDMNAKVTEITAFDAMKALTGINDIRTKRAERKEAMMLHASKMLGRPVPEHASDALGIALAYLKKQAEPV